MIKSVKSRPVAPGRQGRQSLLLCMLLILTVVAVLLWTAPLRLERRLREASLQELEAASHSQPDAPRPAYYLGRRWLQLGNLPAAHSAFERAAHHASDDEAAWLGFAMTAVGPTAPQQAAATLTSFLALHPRSAPAHLALGEVYRRGHAHPYAYQEALRAAHLAPRDADAWKLIGGEALTLGQLPQAIDALRRALTLQPDDWRAQIGLAESLFRSRRQEEGRVCLRAASRLAPQEPLIWRALLRAAATKAEAQTAQQGLAAAIAAQQAAPAVPSLPPMRLPDAVPAAMLLRDADALCAQNRLPEAKRAYLAILAQDSLPAPAPLLARAWQGAGMAARAQGELEDAYYFLERATDLDARLPQAQFALGTWYLGDGFKTEAARRLALAAQDAPQNPACWHALGQAQSGLEVANAQAEQSYRRAVELDPLNVVYLLDLADLLVVNSHTDEAERFYRRAIAVAPHDADALSRFGGFLLDVHPSPERLQEASRMLTEAVRVDPRSDFAWYQSGRLASVRSEDRQAIRALRKAVALAPRIAEGWYALSRSYQRAGDQSHADAALRRFRLLRTQDQERTHTYELLDLHPHDDGLHRKLARLYVLDGEYAKAIFEYATYLQLHPEDAVVRREWVALQTQLKRQGRLPAMSLFTAMIASSRRHNPRPKTS